MQSVSSDFIAKATASYREVLHGLLVSWTKAINPSYGFFTIGTSAIAGPDSIKGSGGTATLFDRYQYSDYTPYLMSWGVDRKIGNLPYGVIVANADIELDNTSKLFLPGFDATIGAYILPERPLKISTGFGGESIQLFVGFSEQPQNTLVRRITKLHAYDAVNYLLQRDATSSTYQDQYTHQIIEAELLAAGFTAGQFVLETSLQQKIGFFSPYGMTVGEAISALVEAEQGLFFADEAGILRFWNRQHLPNNTTSRATFNYSRLEDLQFDSAPVINDVIVRSTPRSVGAHQRVWELSAPVLVPAGGSIDVFADFSDEFGPLPVTAITAPTYNALNDSNYLTNMKEDGTGEAGNSYITRTSTQLFGNSYRVTFSNSFTSPVYITEMALFGTPAKVKVIIEERYTNNTSIDSYGRNPQNLGQPLEISNNAIQDADTARAIGYILVNDYSTPRTRYRARAFAHPHLQIGDVVTLTVADTGETLTPYIVGKTDHGSRERILGQELILEVRTILKYFTIEQSAISSTDRIAP